MKLRDLLMGIVIGGISGYLISKGEQVSASPSVPKAMLAVGRNIQVEITNPEKNIQYIRTMDVDQWYCRVLNYSVNLNVRDGWRLQSLILGLEDLELPSEADNYGDVILFLDFLYKGSEFKAELSLFVDGAPNYTKIVTYLPTGEVLFRFFEEGVYFKAWVPFELSLPMFPF